MTTDPGGRPRTPRPWDLGKRHVGEQPRTTARAWGSMGRRFKSCQPDVRNIRSGAVSGKPGAALLFVRGDLTARPPALLRLPSDQGEQPVRDDDRRLQTLLRFPQLDSASSPRTRWPVRTPAGPMPMWRQYRTVAELVRSRAATSSAVSSRTVTGAPGRGRWLRAPAAIHAQQASSPVDDCQCRWELSAGVRGRRRRDVTPR